VSGFPSFAGLDGALAANGNGDVHAKTQRREEQPNAHAKAQRREEQPHGMNGLCPLFIVLAFLCGFASWRELLCLCVCTPRQPASPTTQS